MMEIQCQKVPTILSVVVPMGDKFEFRMIFRRSAPEGRLSGLTTSEKAFRSDVHQALRGIFGGADFKDAATGYTISISGATFHNGRASLMMESYVEVTAFNPDRSYFAVPNNSGMDLPPINWLVDGLHKKGFKESRS